MKRSTIRTPRTKSLPSKPRQTRRRQAPRAGRAATVDVAALDLQELEAMRIEIARLAERSSPPRWNANPDDVKRSVLKLVLTLVELIRQLLERQAIRRMDAGTLTADQTESVGLALMRLEETVRDLAAQFEIDPSELNLDLGPVGKLL